MGSYGDNDDDDDDDTRGGSRRQSMTPTSAGRGSESDGGGGGGGREVFSSERSHAAPSPRRAGSGSSSPCFFSSPDSSSLSARKVDKVDKVLVDAADKENKVLVARAKQQARAPAWEAGGGKTRRESSGGGKCGVLGGRATRAAAVTPAAAGPPPENSKIRSVAARSPATRGGLQEMDARQGGLSSRSTSRGRWVRVRDQRSARGGLTAVSLRCKSCRCVGCKFVDVWGVGGLVAELWHVSLGVVFVAGVRALVSFSRQLSRSQRWVLQVLIFAANKVLKS